MQETLLLKDQHFIQLYLKNIESSSLQFLHRQPKIKCPTCAEQNRFHTIIGVKKVYILNCRSHLSFPLSSPACWLLTNPFTEWIINARPTPAKPVCRQAEEYQKNGLGFRPPLNH